MTIHEEMTCRELVDVITDGASPDTLGAVAL